MFTTCLTNDRMILTLLSYYYHQDQMYHTRKGYSSIHPPRYYLEIPAERLSIEI